MTAEGESEKSGAEVQHQLRGLEREAIIARSETRVARTKEAIHGLGYRSVAQALAEYDNAVVAHATMLAASETHGAEGHESEHRTEQADDSVTKASDDVVSQSPSHTVQRQ